MPYFDLHTGIDEGACKRLGTMRKGVIVAVRVCMNGYQTAYGVVRRLHEVGGFEQLLAVERDIVKEGERVGHASLGWRVIKWTLMKWCAT